MLTVIKVFIICFFGIPLTGAILFLIVGIIGEYIAILFSELKDRPIYIVQETQNVEKKSV